MAVGDAGIFITVGGGASSPLEYTLSGTQVPLSLEPLGGLYGQIAISGNDMFLTVNYSGGGFGIAEYTTSGTLVNATVATTSDSVPGDIAVIPTPEPSTWILLLLGAGALFAFRRPLR
jgi:hypothetical protein